MDITIKNLDPDKLMLVAKYEQYKPSSTDLTKAEMAAEVVKNIVDRISDHAAVKHAKSLVTVTPSNVEVEASG